MIDTKKLNKDTKEKLDNEFINGLHDIINSYTKISGVRIMTILMPEIEENKFKFLSKICRIINKICFDRLDEGVLIKASSIENEELEKKLMDFFNNNL